MAKLSGKQVEQLRDAILDAFTLEDLTQFLPLRLDQDLSHITLGANLKPVVFDVIMQSQREGWTEDLLHAVADERPKRADIQALVAELLTALGSAPSPASSASQAPAVSRRAPVVEPAPSADASVTPPPVSGADPLLITAPIRMEFVLVDDGRPLWMGTPPGQVQDMRKRFLWAQPCDEKGYFRREQPDGKVPVMPFAIGRYPVTNAQYAAFIKATGHPAPSHFEWDNPPSGRVDHPVVNVTWRDAVAFTEWLSGASGRPVRLPTEVEWEKAARGAADGRLWPWGDQWDPQRANARGSGTWTTTPVGAYSPQGDSPCGAADMAGNVWEWCSTKWREDYTTPPDDSLTGEDARVVRGGSYDDDLWFARCASRRGRHPSDSDYLLGFRVAKSVSS